MHFGAPAKHLARMGCKIGVQDRSPTRFLVAPRGNMRFGAILPVLLTVMSSPQASDVPSDGKTRPATGRLFAQGRQGGARNSQQPETEHCAYIVISEAPGTDPDMIKKIPKRLADNMPMLKVPPPCDQGRRANK